MNNISASRLQKSPRTFPGGVFTSIPRSARATSKVPVTKVVGLRPAAGLRLAPQTRPFGLYVIDGVGPMMIESFRLRYQVYCIERQFLPAADYPSGLETDEFDETSVHLGAVDSNGRVAGTARLVLPVKGTLPTFQHCSETTFARPLWGRNERWVEVSRLCVSRAYGRSEPATDVTSSAGRGEIMLAVIKAICLASKRLDATHCLLSIERSLQRLLVRSGFPIRQLGPQFDYLGPVAPYGMDFREFEAVIRTGHYPQIIDFMTGEGCDPALPDSVPLAALLQQQSRYEGVDASA